MAGNGFIQFVDASKMYRNLDVAKNVINKMVAEALVDGLEEEFMTLVIETPQWTGTTAASWNVGTGNVAGDSTAGVRVQSERKRKNALSAGHLAAVNIALSENWDNFEAYKKSYTLTNLTFYNNAPGAVTAEEGPLRPANIPPGTEAFERFKLRIQGRNYQVYKDFEI